jgi:hypothetical protein
MLLLSLKSLTHAHTPTKLSLRDPHLLSFSRSLDFLTTRFLPLTNARLSASRCPKGLPPPLQLKLCRIAQPNSFFLPPLPPSPIYWFASNLYAFLSRSSQPTVNQHTTHACATVILGSVNTACFHPSCIACFICDIYHLQATRLKQYGCWSSDCLLHSSSLTRSNNAPPHHNRPQLCNSCQPTNWPTFLKSSRHLIAGATAGCRTLKR